MTDPILTTHSDSEYLSTLERGLSVLRAFGRDNPQMTLSEVAEVTSLSPAAARRCLHTLVKLGYVAKHHRHFLLRPEVMSFASAYLDSMSLGELVRPHLQQVRDETGDSSSLAVLSGYDILYLVHVSTNRMVRLAAGVGTRYPAYATSLGRAMLAFETPSDVRNPYLDTGESHTSSPSTRSPAAPICADRRVGARCVSRTAMPLHRTSSITASSRWRFRSWTKAAVRWLRSTARPRPRASGQWRNWSSTRLPAAARSAARTIEQRTAPPAVPAPLGAPGLSDARGGGDAARRFRPNPAPFRTSCRDVDPPACAAHL